MPSDHSELESFKESDHAGLLNVNCNALFLKGNFSDKQECGLLPEIKRVVILSSMLSFNSKSIAITLIGTLNIYYRTEHFIRYIRKGDTPPTPITKDFINFMSCDKKPKYFHSPCF